jgi:DNA helicase-2/ATP-dependent DNA helicase PcrA
MATSLVDGLNPQQRAAITAGEGPVLVLAGPGSGKTRVLTHRIAYLIREMNVPPEAIVAVTFTNKAAGEMRARVEALMGGAMRGLTIGTFHSICARLLRREGQHTPYGSDYVIFDTDDQVTVITQALNEMNIDTSKFNPRRILGAVSTAKNELITPSDFKALDYFGEVVARAYPRYQAVLLDNNAMDFDDLLMQMALLLRDNPTVAEKYRRLFGFVLVDEFQDTNTAQYELVRLMAAPQNNVFVVGDEDQGIYAFRGADYRNVLRFRQDYPSAQVVLLEQNYRSPQPVLDVARAIIDKNTHRTPKALFTDRRDGEKITVYEAYNEDFEARYIIEQIDDLCRREKLDYGDFAVMYRTNAQSRALEEAFIREGVPYVLIGGVGFYKRREVRDLLAYLRVVNNPNDKVSFARVVNVPRRGIGEKSLREFQNWAATECSGYDDALDRLLRGEASPINARTRRLFADFALQIKGWRELASSGDLIGLLDRIIADTGYNLYLHEMSDNEDQARERSENIQELRGLVRRAQDEGTVLGEFLVDQSLLSDVDELKAGGNAVTLLTLHAAKGLEYPVVFITGLEEGLMPHQRAFEEPDGMSEERRLMYVGVTRAEQRLFLTYAFRRTMYGSNQANVPSRFLADLPPERIEGLTPRATSRTDQTRYRADTTWASASTSNAGQSRLARDLARGTGASGSSASGKIIPFSKAGGAPKPALRFTSGATVRHPKYGSGTVIQSKSIPDDEEVVVAFHDKKIGIKTLYASYGLSLE